MVINYASRLGSICTIEESNSLIIFPFRKIQRYENSDLLHKYASKKEMLIVNNNQPIVLCELWHGCPTEIKNTRKMSFVCSLAKSVNGLFHIICVVIFVKDLGRNTNKQTSSCCYSSTPLRLPDDNLSKVLNLDLLELFDVGSILKMWPN